MPEVKKFAVVPCYRVALHVAGVIRSIPPLISTIIVVDDACPEGSGKIAASAGDPRVVVITNPVNLGVGGAVAAGYRKAVEMGAGIIVKIDGDGQMDPSYIEALTRPVETGEADYTKGNRFHDFKALRSMPGIRLFGNSVLSFMLKLSSGYWNIMDPTNGFTAISRDALAKINLEKIAARYFFESDMLIHLNIQNCVLRDIPMPARYGDEKSSMRLERIILKFPFRMMRGLMRRIFFKYFIYDFNMASVYILLGIPMVLWGVGFGAYKWIDGILLNYENTTGTVMLSVLPLILGSQFLLAAVNIDINSIPRRGNA